MATSLTQAEASARAAALEVQHYQVACEFSAEDDQWFVSRTAIELTAHEHVGTFCDLVGARELFLTVDGELISDIDYDGSRVALTLEAGVHEVIITACLPYAPDGDGMHRFTDPADGATYVCGFAGMDVARRMFACFDQPDVKATFDVEVVAPEQWRVLANGAALSTEPCGGGTRRTTFATTQRMSTYLFVVCAGPWASVEWSRDGRQFGWHARASLTSQLERDAEELKRVTDTCFDYYANRFDACYPFGDYHQVFAPGLNWGALETPGCVTFTDDYLTPETPSLVSNTGRAVVIAHEMAHMWFGNLVTMRWWVDTWLQESFADYMGFRVAAQAAGYPTSWPMFTSGRKVGAYLADECASTHPVAPKADSVPNVDAAFNNFDAISYAKGTSVLTQLVRWMGDDAFFAGLNTYLSRHAFDNAEFADLIACLDEHCERDVAGWVRQWFNTTGFDALHVAPNAGGVQVTLAQAEAARSHVLTVGAYAIGSSDAGSGDAASTGSVTTTIELGPDERSAQIAVDPKQRVVVPNSDGATYASVSYEPSMWEQVLSQLATVDDEQARAVMWWSVWQAVRTGELSAERVAQAACQAAASESSPILLDKIPTLAGMFVEPRLAHAELGRYAGGMADALSRNASSDNADLALRQSAATWWTRMATDNEALRATAFDAAPVLGISSNFDLRWQALTRLISLGGATSDHAEHLAAADRTARGERMLALARASIPTAEAKCAALRSVLEVPLSKLNNRILGATLTGVWDLASSPAWLECLDVYFDSAPRVAAASQGLARIVGRLGPTLHHDDVRSAYASALESDVPQVLRRGWSDTYDELTRTARGAGQVPR